MLYSNRDRGADAAPIRPRGARLRLRVRRGLPDRQGTMSGLILGPLYRFLQVFSSAGGRASMSSRASFRLGGRVAIGPRASFRLGTRANA